MTKIWRRRVLLVANAHVLLSCVFNHFGGLLHPVKNSCPCSQTPLSGVMPPQLGDLDALQVLHLRYNKFEGKLSRSPLRYCRTSLFPFVANFRGLGESFLEKCRVRINSAAFVHFLSSLTYYPYLHIVGCADKDCCVRQYKLDSCISNRHIHCPHLRLFYPLFSLSKFLCGVSIPYTPVSPTTTHFVRVSDFSSVKIAPQTRSLPLTHVSASTWFLALV